MILETTVMWIICPHQGRPNQLQSINTFHQFQSINTFHQFQDRNFFEFLEKNTTVSLHLQLPTTTLQWN